MTCAATSDIGAKLVQRYGAKWRTKKLADLTWFRVGGPAEWFVSVPDQATLEAVLKLLPPSMDLFVLGAGSNVLIRDGGVAGVVLRLGRGFSKITPLAGHRFRVGAGVLDVALARAAQKANVAGLEFYSGIPGTIGGALAMNAGAFGGETAQCLVEATAFTRHGDKKILTVDDLGYAYRYCARAADLIFVEAVVQGQAGDSKPIAQRMAAIKAQRQKSQPLKQRTGGSTFRNPHGPDAEPKAWELIAQAGGRGLRLGQAQMSDTHCNFMINRGGATARELELLGKLVQSKVLQNSRVALEWEIHRIGQKLGHGI